MSGGGAFGEANVLTEVSSVWGPVARLGWGAGDPQLLAWCLRWRQHVNEQFTKTLAKRRGRGRGQGTAAGVRQAGWGIITTAITAVIILGVSHLIPTST